MKKPLLFTFLFAASAASAQMTSANEPVIGDLSSMYLCDSLTDNLDAVTGSGVTWDYTSLMGYGSAETRTVEITDPVTTPYVDSFPGATKVYEVEGSLKTYFSSNGTERVSQGFHLSEPSLGDVLAMVAPNPQTMVTYPFAYGNSLTDAFDGHVSFEFNFMPIYESLAGNAYAWVDGEGTLALPNGVNVSNVIRYKSLDTAATNLPIIGAVDLIRVQYEYYDYSDQNLPIFIHSSVYMAPTGGGLAISETHLVLSKYAPNFVGLKEEQAINFNVYPNPAQHEIKISGDFSDEAQAVIVDQSGRTLKTLSVTSGQTIDISDLATGMYMLTIEDNGIMTTKSIVKK